MAVQITVRNVPEEVRDELAKRAAAQRQSMQAFLLSELERMAHRPSTEEILARVRERQAIYQTRVSTADILAARDADRK